MSVFIDFKGSVFNQKERLELKLTEQLTTLDALNQVVEQHQSLKSLLFKDGKVRSDILVIVDRVDVKALKQLNEPLKAGQVITILPLAHGG